MDDEELLHEIYKMASEDKGIYQLSAAQKLQMGKAKNEIKKGMFSAHEEVKKRTSEWLN
jgi:hypothetical protein